MAINGVVFYRGPSLLTGDPIVGVLTGVDGSSANPKTGPMCQGWILRSDIAPMDAKRQNIDDAVCGDCKLRGKDGNDSVCYVAPWIAPNAVYRMMLDGGYAEATWPDLQAVVEGRPVRLGAYGDPAAIPFDVWRAMLVTTSTWVGYTHSWKTCDQRLKTIVMASVDTVEEFHRAHLAGWRTFRIRRRGEALVEGHEFVCPASDESAHRATCESCRLCRGRSSPARSVAIYPHGKPSSLRMFRPEALA